MVTHTQVGNLAAFSSSHFVMNLSYVPVNSHVMDTLIQEARRLHTLTHTSTSS